MDFAVVSPTDGVDWYKRVKDAVEAQYADRRIAPGDLDGREASFDVAVMDAAVALGLPIAYNDKEQVWVLSAIPGIDPETVQF